MRGARPVFSRRDLVGAGVVAPLVTLPLLSSCAKAVLHSTLPQEQVQAAAPFSMPIIAIPDFTRAPRFPITDFGAVPGDTQRNRMAIASAIESAHRSGGGRVVVPPGVWSTGPIHLRSNVALHLERGALLLFSADPADYLPAVPTSWEGIECVNYSPLIYAFDCENVAITGHGTMRAQLDTWREWYKRSPEHLAALVDLYQMARRGVPVDKRDMTHGSANLRPHFIQFNRCRHVLVEDIRIENSPFWVLHPYLCRDVVIRRVEIEAHGHNNDGVDPEMSQNVVIEDCTFDQGDDAVSVKSGRDHDAWRLNTPARNIVMRRCRVKNGHQLIAIGSELSGGIENVFVDDCHFDYGAVRAATPINNLLFVKTNERRGGYVRNIHMSNVSASRIEGGVLSVDTDVLYQWRTLTPTYDRRLTAISGLHISNIEVDRADFICEIKGEAELPVQNVVLRRVRVAALAGRDVRNENVRKFRMSE